MEEGFDLYEVEEEIRRTEAYLRSSGMPPSSSSSEPPTNAAAPSTTSRDLITSRGREEEDMGGSSGGGGGLGRRHRTPERPEIPVSTASFVIIIIDIEHHTTNLLFPS